MLIEVAFKGNRKEFFNWDGSDPLPTRAPVVVEADRGEDLGYVHAQGEIAEQRIKGVPHAPEEGVTRAVRRLATAHEVRRAEELRDEDAAARRKAMERVKANGLAMKLTDAEWRWDLRKLTIYFTSEKRVDFRNLVRELASMFRTRIELKQIGVRDEAKRLGGIGRCGREYCSASWLPDLRPVNLGVARDQRLSLNPTQISGACGRLMCCLRYEHEFYVQQRKRFPKEGKIIETSLGEEKVVSNDIFRERVTLRGAEGDTRILPLTELRREWKNAPPADRATEEETPAIPFEGLSDEVLRLQDTAEMPAWLPRSSAKASTRRTLPVRDAAADEPKTSAGDERTASGGQGARGRRPDAPSLVQNTPTQAAAGPANVPLQTPDGLAADGAESDPTGVRRRNRRRRGRRGGGGRPDETGPGLADTDPPPSAPREDA